MNHPRLLLKLIYIALLASFTLSLDNRCNSGQLSGGTMCTVYITNTNTADLQCESIEASNRILNVATGNCECQGSNYQKCYKNVAGFPCVDASDHSGIVSNNDMFLCTASCTDTSKCIDLYNKVCYSVGTDVDSLEKIGVNCQCYSSHYCYVPGDKDDEPYCTLPGLSSISQNDNFTCSPNIANAGSCSSSSKCFHNDGTDNNICYTFDNTNSLMTNVDEGTECECKDHRSCIVADNTDRDELKCITFEEAAGLTHVSRFSKYEPCQQDGDASLCSEEDQCWHEVNRVCTPHNAWGQGKGKCKLSQYILVLNNQIVGEGAEGEFHPVFIVNSFKDLSDITYLNNLTTDLVQYYRTEINADYSTTWSDLKSDSDFLFAHMRKTYTTNDSGTSDTFEYWNFGGNVSTDSYQQEQIKQGNYLWNLNADETGKYYMVFWYPKDTYMGSDNCYEDNSARSGSAKNDIRPLFLKMRYFYKYHTAKKYYDSILAGSDIAAYLIRPPSDNDVNQDHESGNHVDHTTFMPEEGNGSFYISIKEILMGFYSAKCSPAP